MEKKIGYIWAEKQFTEDNFIVYRVRSISHPTAIALIKVSPHDYTIFKGEHDLKLGEILTVHKIAKNLMDDHFRYSS